MICMNVPEYKSKLRLEPKANSSISVTFDKWQTIARLLAFGFEDSEIGALLTAGVFAESVKSTSQDVSALERDTPS